MNSISGLASSAGASSSASGAFVKTANGEYTAASVAKDPTDATKLGLVKEKDGNYGTAKPTQVAPATTISSPVSSAVGAALTTLQLGGA